MRVTFNTPLTKSLNLGHGKVKNNTVSQNSTQNSPIKNTLMDNPALRYGISFKAGYKDSDEEESLKKLEEYIEKNPEKKDMYETIINSAFYKNSQQIDNRPACLLSILLDYNPKDTKTKEVIEKVLERSNEERRLYNYYYTTSSLMGYLKDIVCGKKEFSPISSLSDEEINLIREAQIMLLDSENPNGTNRTKRFSLKWVAQMTTENDFTSETIEMLRILVEAPATDGKEGFRFSAGNIEDIYNNCKLLAPNQTELLEASIKFDKWDGEKKDYAPYTPDEIMDLLAKNSEIHNLLRRYK